MRISDVHAIRYPAASVYCAYAQCMPKEKEVRVVGRQTLSRLLLEYAGRCGRQTPQPGEHPCGDVTIGHDFFGRPLLFYRGLEGPAISFSHQADGVWAALSEVGAGLGIDAARAEEFTGAYPYGRVFRAGEIGRAMEIAGGGLPDAAAFLWTVKEAVVKAHGYGFRFISPLDITVDSIAGGPADYRSLIGFSENVCRRFATLRADAFMTQTFRSGRSWVSVTSVDCDQRGCRAKGRAIWPTEQ